MAISADKVWGKFNGADKEQQLQQALSAADPQTDLPLALEADYFRISPAAYFVPVSVKIPGSVIALAAKGGASETEFDFVGQIRTSASTSSPRSATTSRSS